jgi:hypothetical protein
MNRSNNKINLVDNSLLLKPSLPKQSRKSLLIQSPSHKTVQNHKTVQKSLKQQLQEEHFELQQQIEIQMNEIRKQQQQSNNNIYDDDNDDDDDDDEKEKEEEEDNNEKQIQLTTIYENDSKNHSLTINKINQDYNENILNTRISPNKQNNKEHFPQVQKINGKKVDVIDCDYFNQVVAALNGKILDAQEETKRGYAKAEIVMKEKERVEERNEELNSKLSDTRQGLRETQSSLQAIQQSTEQYIQRRDSKDVQYQKIMTDNKNLLLKISELEENCRDLESSYKTEIYNRDDSNQRLQEKLDSSQETLSNNKTENVRLQCEMTLIVAELETTKRNFDTLESKHKNTENSIRNEYKNEIVWLEDRLKISQNKIENEDFLKTSIITLKQDLKGKNETIRYLETKLEEMTSDKRDLDTKYTALVNQLRQNDTNKRLLETKIRNLEVDYNRSLKDNTNLTRNITTTEDLLREMTKKSASLLTDKQNLQDLKSDVVNQLEELKTVSHNKDLEIVRLNTFLNEAVDCLETIEIVEENELFNYEDKNNEDNANNDDYGDNNNNNISNDKDDDNDNNNIDNNDDIIIINNNNNNNNYNYKDNDNISKSSSIIENVIINEDVIAVKVKSINELFGSNNDDLDELFNTEDLEDDQFLLNEMKPLDVSLNDSFDDQLIMKDDEN